MTKIECLLLFWASVLTVACSSVEDNLRQLAQSPSSVIAVQDTGNGYWGLPGSAIEQVNGNTIMLKANERVQYCSSGEGLAEILGRAMLGDVREIGRSGMTWNSESTYGRQPVEAGPDNTIRTNGRGIVALRRSTGENAFSLSDCVQGRIEEETKVEVKEILFSSSE